MTPFMTHVTCRLTAKNRDQLRNPALGNRVWATFFTVIRVRPRRLFREDRQFVHGNVGVRPAEYLVDGGANLRVAGAGPHPQELHETVARVAEVAAELETALDRHAEPGRHQLRLELVAVGRASAESLHQRHDARAHRADVAADHDDTGVGEAVRHQLLKQSAPGRDTDVTEDVDQQHGVDGAAAASDVPNSDPAFDRRFRDGRFHAGKSAGLRACNRLNDNYRLNV